MSAIVDGRLISSWTLDELSDGLDRIVATTNADRHTIIVAEACARLLPMLREFQRREGDRP